MTGTASSGGKMFYDFGSYKNQEWLRRRKLRIEQVRRQSKEIAKALRQKVENEEKIRSKIFEKIEEAKFKCWRAEKLDEMERKLRCALEEFGLGHRLAEAEVCPDDMIAAKNKINTFKAQERGEKAKQNEVKRRKMEEKIKQSPIERKKMTRRVEDLRSALIRSISVHTQEGENEHCQPKLMPEKGLFKNEFSPRKNQKVSVQPQLQDTLLKKNLKNSFLMDEPVQDQPLKKSTSEVMKPVPPLQKNETIWIDLNDIQNSSERKFHGSKVVHNDEQSKSGSIKPVEFYDYYSRYNCKSFREYENLVEKIDYEIDEKAIKEVENEEKAKELERNKKLQARIACEERGQEALRKEKLKRDYKEMIAKLEDLNKREKLIKAHQPSSTDVLYMTDERLLEKAKTKQRIMNTKFESIYYNATSEMPPDRPARSDMEEIINDNDTPTENASVKLSFSPENLKNNTPMSPTKLESTSPAGNPPVRSLGPMKRKRRKLKKKLIMDIDRALKEGRKLRESLMNNWEETTVGDGLNEYDSGTDGVTESIKTPWESGDDRVTKCKEVLDQEAQTDDIQIGEKCLKVDFAAQVGNDMSLCNMSSSTSYKSPPSEISCYSYHPVLNCLGNKGKIGSEDLVNDFNEFITHRVHPLADDVDDSEDHLHLKSNPKLRRKVEEMLSELLCEMKSSETNGLQPRRGSSSNPELKYYIKKLLNMSRECVANLSISSDNNSTKLTSDVQCSHLCDQSEEQSLSSEENGGEQVEEELCEYHSIQRQNEPARIWKSLLEKISDENEENEVQEDSSPEQGNEINADEYEKEKSDSEWSHDGTLTKEEEEEGQNLQMNVKTQSDLDRITEKCSRRISELTDLLTKVRRDKEILLATTSEASSSSDFPSRLKLKALAESTVDMAEKNAQKTNDAAVKYKSPSTTLEHRSRVGNDERTSITNGDVSLASTETFPDVMNELLEKRIITSPFKWCEGDFSKELDTSLKPSSIETVIGNFRRRISRIKPFSLASSDAVRCCSPSIPGRYADETSTREDGTSDFEFCRELSPPEKLEKLSGGHEESLLENMDLAFRNLGLNWAKSFLKKIEESKAMSSSSCSEEKKNLRQ